MARTCARCGSSISDGDAFCQGCGSRAVAAPPVYEASLTVFEQEAPAVAVVPGWSADSAVLPTGPAPASAAMNAAVGAVEVNSAYVGRRLMYDTNLEPSFDPLGSSRFLSQMGLRGLLYWMIVAFAAIPMVIIGFLIPVLGILVDV